jgi:hypothetical protein
MGDDEKRNVGWTRNDDQKVNAGVLVRNAGDSSKNGGGAFQVWDIGRAPSKIQKCARGGER